MEGTCRYLTCPDSGPGALAFVQHSTESPCTQWKGNARRTAARTGTLGCTSTWKPGGHLTWALSVPGTCGQGTT